ncbi:nucleotide-diphospho-sugar transferase [Stachybotrys elegans]|uniref:Nucleotide-diphospho-sugar transferase n=1 Tax=Stachybotrys elegans TaxID=80388 RepID=A0A8K0SJQ6_9HYPO|nr:nucleotide-diphospho-sugar transferase [Stachybotrys elegans]
MTHILRRWFGTNGFLYEKIDDGVFKKSDDLPSPGSYFTTSPTSPGSPILPFAELGTSSKEIIYARGASEKEHYVIHKLPEDAYFDDLSLSPWRKRVHGYLGVTALMVVPLMLWAQAIQFNVIWNGTFAYRVDTKLRLGLIWASFMVQLVKNVTKSWQAVLLCFSLGKSRKPRLLLQGTSLPRVDVVITVCKESLDVVQDTVLAALNIDYPADRFRVLISDDGASQALELWAVSLQRKYENLYYTARAPNVRTGFKAGNLNHAMDFLRALPGGRAEFMAGLDTDMIPEKHWLRSLMAHMVLDTNLGLVCPTQLFYNSPENDPLHQGQTTSWRSQDTIRDMIGSAWNTGSGWLARRQALDDIGGFSTEILIEDLYSSIRMMAEGWKTAYVAEALQYGLMPNTYDAHLKQFLRWNIGGCQTFVKMGYFIKPSICKSLTFTQRLNGFLTGIAAWVTPFFVTTDIIVTCLLLATGLPFIYYHNVEEVKLLLTLSCACSLLDWALMIHIGLTAGYQASVRDACIAYMHPYYVVNILRNFVLPASLGGIVPNFTATGSVSVPVNERNHYKRTPLIRRLSHFLFRSGGMFLVIAIAAIVLSVTVRGLGFIRGWQLENSVVAGQDVWVIFLTTLGWPPLGWLLIILDLCMPILYMISPPTVPDRDDMMGRRDENQVRYPRPEFRHTKWSWNQLRLPALYHLIPLYLMAMMAMSRFL